MGQETDVFVVGGGPAGIATAIAARTKGLRVIVADGAKPPIAKACGEGLLPEAVAWLDEFGVKLSESDGWKLRGIRFEDGRVSVSGNLPDGQGIGVRREVLHQRMVERARECGVSFLWETPVAGLEQGMVTAGGKEIRARWIVGADGGRSRVRRWSGLESSEAQRNRFAIRRHYRLAPWSDFTEIHWGEEMQAYVTPVGAQEICVVLISKTPNLSFDESMSAFPKLAGRFHGASVASTERGAVTSMFQLKRVYRGNVALVGDASGSVDAITGEGIALSFMEAAALADALAAEDLGRYQEAHRRLIRRPRLMGNFLLLLGRQSGLRKRTLRAFESGPEFFDRMLAFHVGKAGPLRLAADGMRFGWRFLVA
ncbi:MAG: NAD(P)/FAD-dependent oxidoreductase [Candidatus Acidiferrum sp.]